MVSHVICWTCSDLLATCKVKGSRLCNSQYIQLSCRRPTFFAQNMLVSNSHGKWSHRTQVLAGLADMVEEIRSPRLAIELISDALRCQAWADAIRTVVAEGRHLTFCTIVSLPPPRPHTRASRQ